MKSLKCTHCEEEAMTAKEFITERCRWCGGDLEEDRRDDDEAENLNITLNPALRQADFSSRFRVGEYVELINHISDGYTEIGDYNVIFPPPTIVKIMEIKEDGWLKYGVKVVKENDLPINLQGKQFRTVMANRAKNGKITFIGNKQSFFDGDEGIEQKHWDKIYWQPESYLRALAENGL